MNTYTWDFPALDVKTSYTDEQDPANTEANVVYNVHWRYTATQDLGDELYSATIIGTQSIDTADLSDFTPYEQLTQVIVEAWVEEALGEEKVAEMQANLDAQLEEQVNPSTVTLTLPEQGA